MASDVREPDIHEVLQQPQGNLAHRIAGSISGNLQSPSFPSGMTRASVPAVPMQSTVSAAPCFENVFELLGSNILSGKLDSTIAEVRAPWAAAATTPMFRRWLDHPRFRVVAEQER